MDDRPPEIVIVAGGEPLGVTDLADIVDSSVVIAADSGVDHAHRAGLAVDVAVGDFDSVSAAGLEQVVAGGGEVVRFPTDKNATDLELALDLACERATARPGRAPRAIVVGVDGGRTDHHLANLLVLAADAHAALDIEIRTEATRAWVVRARLALDLTVGSTLSLLPLHGPATVSLTGVRWPLDAEVLAAGSTRGMSNRTTAAETVLTVHDGVVLAVVPTDPDPSLPEEP